MLVACLCVRACVCTRYKVLQYHTGWAKTQDNSSGEPSKGNPSVLCCDCQPANHCTNVTALLP